jgi:hypothetical protein
MPWGERPHAALWVVRVLWWLGLACFGAARSRAFTRSRQPQRFRGNWAAFLTPAVFVLFRLFWRSWAFSSQRSGDLGVFVATSLWLLGPQFLASPRGVSGLHLDDVIGLQLVLQHSGLRSHGRAVLVAGVFVGPRA